jgi:lycopene beta-cyclase
VTVAVVGAGAAGLALAVALAARGRPDVVLVQSPDSGPPRTWCSWQREPQWWEPAVRAQWTRIALHGPDGSEQRHDLAPLRYVMVRSPDYDRLAGRLLEGIVRRVAAHVDEVGEGRVRGRLPDGAALDVRADLVFDTRPAPPARPGRTLLQHFRGWFLRTTEDAFDPGLAGLMDFRVPQPARGVAFAYVLPTSAREALVEYTEFSRTPLSRAAYDEALASCTRALPPFEVLDAEQGVIPMTSAPFTRRLDARTFRLGAAGGATRPSTGYTFSAAQRQARAVADALAAGEDPCPPLPYPRRHLLMDALLLRGLDRGDVDGAAFLTRLFARQPVERVLRFLDGGTTPLEDLAVMGAAPPGQMLRALLPGAAVSSR